MLSREVRRLQQRWTRGDYPKHLEWLEISGLRGWTGQRVDFRFPIVAVVGENGTGKSTILQAAAAIYKAPAGKKSYFASEFFPDSPWERVTDVRIRASVKEGEDTHIVSVRKPTERWRGNPERRIREVKFLDLRRTQPIAARIGYARMAKANVAVGASTPFVEDDLRRLSAIIGKSFDRASMSTSAMDPNRPVPVLRHGEAEYSGFHQGAGETTVADLVSLNVPEYGIILVDEIETSLHPRAQRRLVRDLADAARVHRCQFILTTHSPYVLEELPAEARVHVLVSEGERKAVFGVSPDFALSKMDESAHPESDIYVEDHESRILVEELLAKFDIELLSRVQVSPFGAASVGKALGTMVEGRRFSRPTLVVLDGDQESAPGCHLLPGNDAPEIVVFQDLAGRNWEGVASTIDRSHADLVDACQLAMTMPDHHEWLRSVGDRLTVGGQELWRAMSRSFVKHLTESPDFVARVREELEGGA